MSKKETGLAVSASESSLAQLRENFPQDAAFERVSLPRISFKSQDVTEGKGKSMKVVVEAGTFFEETQVKDDQGQLQIDPETQKPQWRSDELGKEIEGIIVFQRKQLKNYNESTEQFTNSPIYDTDEEIVPLFQDGAEVARATPAELKKSYEYVDENGKTKSKLEENRILYVLVDGVMHQLNLRGSSMFSFLGYARKTLVPSVLTHFSSEPMEKGSIAWNKMLFTAVRPLSEKEAQIVIEQQNELKSAITQQKAFFASRDASRVADPLAEDMKK